MGKDCTEQVDDCALSTKKRTGIMNYGQDFPYIRGIIPTTTIRESVSDITSLIPLTVQWCDIVLQNVHDPTEGQLL
jgi:hypothetical protein